MAAVLADIVALSPGHRPAHAKRADLALLARDWAASAAAARHALWYGGQPV